jgi:hypothetical protein
MKRFVQKFDRLENVICFFIGLICCLWLFLPLPGNTTDSVADQIVSINVKAQPLGEVLEHISEETGYQFRIDQSWQDFLITASFKNEPLHRGLKKILRQLNNAIIYGSDGTIKIMIYGETLSSDTPTHRPTHQPIIRTVAEEPIIQEDQESDPESVENGNGQEEQTDEEPETEIDEESQTSESQETGDESEDGSDKEDDAETGTN